MSNLELTKSAAAARLVVSAVRMARRGEDDLAVYVVAASAFNMLRELLNARGEPYTETLVKSYILDAAIAKLNGVAREVAAHPEALSHVVETVADGLRSGEVQGINDFSLGIDHIEDRRWLDHLIAPYNFLKHASRDPLKSLSESAVKPRDACIAAITAFVILFPADQLPGEIKAFLKSEGMLD